MMIMKRFLSILMTLPLLYPAAATPTATDTITVINEDFSLLTSGSEETPSSETLVGDLGYVKDTTLFAPTDTTCTRTWGGNNLYSAGGSLAILNGGSHGFGFLNTPAGNMSGRLSISFRAKLLPGTTPANASIDVILLSRKVLIDYGRWNVTLTPEWQTFTMEATNGWFNETGVQFMPLGDASFLIDDIRVQRVQTSIIPPETSAPTEMTETGFTAQWTPTQEAEDYLLSVYSKEDNPSALEVSEDFEGILAKEDGSIADPASLPEAWDFAWNGAQEGRIAIEESTEGRKSVRLSEWGDHVETPTYSNSLNKFSISLKAEADSVLAGTALIYVREQNGWFPWQYVSMEALRQLGEWTEIDLTQQLLMFDNVLGVRVEYQPAKGDNGALLVDKLTYTIPGEPILHYALKDEVVEGRSTDHYTVDGLDADTDYFYSVKAHNARFTSAASKEIEAYYVTRPEALEATDITEDGYTANWNAGNKADYFRIDQVQETQLTEDADSFVVLYEDFSKVTAEPGADMDWPDYGPQTSTYMPIDKYTLVGGWKASSWQYVDGWFGGAQQMEEGAIPGAIATPVIDLSHNDGTCTVTIRAYGYGGDWLIIQGVGAATRAYFEFPAEGGIVEKTLDLPLCSSREYLTFYSNNYYPFLIDYIKITQKMKAGETASVITKSLTTNDASTRSAHIGEANFNDASDTRYKVTAFRYYHGDENDIWSSEPSNYVTVKAATTSVSTVSAPNGITVRGAKGGIIVSASGTPQPIAVYSLGGSIVMQRTIASGTHFLPILPGAYAIKAGGRGTKVVVY